LIESRIDSRVRFVESYNVMTSYVLNNDKLKAVY